MSKVFCLAICVLGSFSAQGQRPEVWIDTLRLASTPVQLRMTCYDSTTRVVFINVHQNEATSLYAGRHFLSSVQRHCLVELRHRRMRLVSFTHKGRRYKIDPNRIFTERGAKSSLQKHNLSYSPGVLATVSGMASRIVNTFIDRKALVVALHNNTDGAYSINSYLSHGNDAAAVFVNEQHDADDFFFTTEKHYFEFLRSKGFNVVLQHQTRVEDDGSLSIYCARNNIPYINVEAQEGHLKQQKEMLLLLQELIESTAAGR